MNKLRTKAIESAGYTLIELLVATALGLSVLASAVVLLVNAQSGYHKLSLSRQIQENGRAALGIIGSEVRIAGFYGLSVMPYTLNTDDVRNLQLGCGGKGWAIDVLRPVQVVQGKNPFAGDCIPDRNLVPGTDMLVIRGADHEPLTPLDVRSGNVYLYTSLGSGSIFVADKDGEVNSEVLARVREKPAELYGFSARIYYVRPCSEMSSGSRSECDEKDNSLPTLVRTTVRGGRVRTEPLVEFVENLQVELGVDTSAVPDGQVDQFLAPQDVLDWSMVVSCRIHVLVRSAGNVAGSRGVKRFDLGTHLVSTNDRYLRKQYSTTLSLRNPAIHHRQI